MKSEKQMVYNVSVPAKASGTQVFAVLATSEAEAIKKCKAGDYLAIVAEEIEVTSLDLDNAEAEVAQDSALSQPAEGEANGR